MSALESAYQRCRSRLQEDEFRATLWGYLCVALFIIALTISMLGCAGETFAPRMEGTMMGAGASSASPPAVGDSIGGALGANPIASLTVHF